MGPTIITTKTTTTETATLRVTKRTRTGATKTTTTNDKNNNNKKRSSGENVKLSNSEYVANVEETLINGIIFKPGIWVHTLRRKENAYIRSSQL